MEIAVHPGLASLDQGYLFEQIAEEITAFQKEHPLSRLISLGIGDVTRPLTPVVAEALAAAAAEMATESGMHGYGPAAGYPFLRKAIAESYSGLACSIAPEEVAVTSGGKEALGAVLSLFDPAIPVWVCEPAYPAYRDCAGCAGHPVQALPCRVEDGFLPKPEAVTEPGIIILCSPNNPTGAVLTAADWQMWVSFAIKSGSLLLTDSAYAAYCTDPMLPHSVYAIPGADRCAIEIGSFSKSDGFTGLRCGWVVLPRACVCACAPAQERQPLLRHWMRWLGCHSNGVSYPVQRAAEAALSPIGLQQREKALRIYRRNAASLEQFFTAAGLPHTGGSHAPYLWVQCPNGDSWGWFRMLLATCGVIVTPGAGFGAAGEGWMRFSAFGRPEDTAEALRRMEPIFRRSTREENE